jgi:methionine-S-sulfoxide reductase
MKRLLIALAIFSAPAFALDKATFAGGCFWCMEAPFDKLPGVTEVVVGYTGGQKDQPTYEEVSSGTTGHAEAVQITFDPAKISYEKLLDAFWMSMDPTDAGGQFYDRGTQYRTAIFYQDDAQKKTALESKEKLEKSARFKSKIVTEITAATKFFAAEDYHQHYYKKSPIRYNYYRLHSGRDQFIEKFWHKKVAAH